MWRELGSLPVDDASRPLRVDCELRTANAELREQLIAGHLTELPPLPLRSHRAN
jgi:hypothetical protein